MILTDAGQAELRANVNQLSDQVSHIQVTHLMRNDHEGTATRIAHRLALRHLNISSPSVVAAAQGPNQNLPDIDLATARGDITWTEADDLAMADVIIRDTDPDGDPVYALAGISITTRRRDGDTACRRDQLLRKATGAPVMLAVIGFAEEYPGAVEEPATFIPFNPEGWPEQ